MFRNKKATGPFARYNMSREKLQRVSLCHAPFTNLLFVQSGDIMVCHYNRGFVVGSYPESDLMSVWNGSKLKELRRSLNDYQPLESCSFCHQEILNDRFYSSGCKKYDYLASRNHRYPKMMEFQLSNHCNLECIMCSGEYSSSIRKNRERGLPYFNPYDARFIQEVEKFLPYLEYASFTGGEPFLNELYFQIWDRISVLNPNLKVSISSNATVLNDRVKKVLSSLNCELTLSIDSIEKETYEHIRKGASLKTTLEHLEYFTNYAVKNKRLLSIKSVIMRDNVKDIPRLYRNFHNQGIQLYPKLVWVPFEHSLKYAEVAEIDSAINVLQDCEWAIGNSVQKFNAERYREIIGQLIHWKEEQLAKTEIPDSLTNEVLLGRLRQDIERSILNDMLLSHSERLEMLEHADRSLRMLFAGLDDGASRQLLFGLIRLPGYFLINEIYRKNAEAFVGRFRV